MAQIEFRANLSSAVFPLVSNFFGRSIIIPQFDQNFQKLAAFSGGDKDRDIGIPQVFYTHNVLPTVNGFQSIGYTRAILPAIPANTAFDKVITLRDTAENKVLYAPAGGKNYIYTGNTRAWNSVNPLTPGLVAGNDVITYAYVKGRTFVCLPGNGIYEYNTTTNIFAQVVFTGIAANTVDAICGANGYLIALIGTTVYWSSVVDPTDFVPSLQTGASSSQVNDIKGLPIIVLPIFNGFIIYTTSNAVAASFTGNIRFPWNFREVPNCGGVKEPDQVTSDSNYSSHFAWTTAGLMQITKTGAEQVYPELTDFIANRVFEDYDSVTGIFTQQYLSSTMNVRLAVIGSRYLVMSYGTDPAVFTHAIVVDLSIKRAGKIKIDHVDCFEWPVPNFFGTHTYDQLIGFSYDDLSGTTYDELDTQQKLFPENKREMAFLQNDGTVEILNFDLDDYTQDAVFFLGKFQLQRNREMTLHNVEVEEVDTANSNFQLKTFGTFDGKTLLTPSSPVLVHTGDAVRKYGTRVSFKNFTLYFGGSFNLVSVLVRVTQAGRPRS